MCISTVLYCHPLTGNNVINFSLHRSFLGIWGLDLNYLKSTNCLRKAPSCSRCSLVHEWRRWLIFPNCSNVSFLSHCTNDYSTAGGAWGCEARGVRDRRQRLGTHHLPCGMPGCVRTAAKPHLSWKQNSLSAQDYSASIYQVFTKLRCKLIWISHQA